MSEGHRVAIIAGAGAGKTTRITARYVHHVVAQNLSPLEIVAVTFTEAAALELKSRVREALNEALGPEDERLAELEAARISTFHSLASAICRQHSNEAGIPGDFTILDEVQGALWLADRVDDALDTLPEGLFRRLGFTRMRTIIRSMLQDPIASRSALGRGYRSWKTVARNLAEQNRTELIAKPEWLAARELLSRVSGPESDKLEPIRREVLQAMYSFERNVELDVSAKQIASAKINVGSSKVWQENLAPVKEAIAAVRAATAVYIESGLLNLTVTVADIEMRRQVNDLRRAYLLVAKELFQAKVQERLLDYSDLEVHALQALKNSSVRSFYHERWRAFLVDEYQDTNRVQEEILSLLMHPSVSRAIVGDPNQSIYGFRRADPRLILVASDQIEADGGVREILPNNYRTHAELVSLFNITFTSIFGSGGYHNQGSVRDRPDLGAPGVSLKRCTVVQDTGTKESRRNLVRAEAINVARMLQEMHGSGYAVLDRETRQVRAMLWSDVAIITRSWSSLDAFANALNSLSLPSVLMGGGNLMLTREARDGAALLRFLADPADDLALAATLKSPLFSLSDADLYGLRNLSAGPLLDALLHGDNHEHARKVIGRLLHCRNSESPGRLLHRAAAETGIEAILISLPAGERRLADWRGFVDLITEIEKTSYDTFSVARILRRVQMSMEDRAGRVEVPRPALEAGNAISLMSIHRSKGLEWPIVVLPDLTRAARSQGGGIYSDPDLGVAVSARDTDKAEQPVLYRILKQRAMELNEAEDKRLLYVAATRARDCLIVTSSSTGNTPQGLAKHLDPALDGAVTENITWTYQPADGVPPIAAESIPVQQDYLRCTAPVFIAPSQVPVTALLTYEICPKRFEYEHIEGNPGVGSGSGAKARLGTLTHISIQYRIDNIMALQRFDPTLHEDYVKEALRLARVYRNDDSILQYREEGQSEVPILYEYEGLTFTGRIDLLGPDFVLDMKTGSSREADYRLQVWLYAKATGRPNAVVYFFGQQPTDAFRPEDAPEIEARIKGIIGSIKRGEFTATPGIRVCDRCRYKRICPDAV